MFILKHTYLSLLLSAKVDIEKGERQMKKKRKNVEVIRL